MQLVTEVSPGEVELNYMWLPTWLGMNTKFKKRMEETVNINGRTLDEAHEIVMNYICGQFPEMLGLRDYLDGLKFVNVKE